MPQLFESLNPPSRPAGPLVETSASDLSKLASRAQQRQQQLVNTSLRLNQSGQVFPAKNDPSVLPNVLGSGPSTLTNLPGFSPLVSNENAQGTTGTTKAEKPAGFDPASFAPPIESPQGLEPAPVDTPYTDLTPTQRNRALGNLGVKVVNFAQNPETGKPWRTDTGATILAVDSKVAGQNVFLAEDAVAAHSVVFQVVRDLGIRAVPGVNQVSTDERGYVIDWEVDAGDVDRFAALMTELAPTRVSEVDGRLRVHFDANHKVNSFFFKNPFGTTEPPPEPVDPIAQYAKQRTSR